MTRSEAMAIITRTLQAADDATLEAAAAHLAKIAAPTGLTVGDVLKAFPSDGVLPRALTDRELALIEQSKEDFRLGRTRSSAESRAHVVAELARRRQSSTTA
jgi:hypothetical protein